MKIERISAAFQRAGWQIVAAPENVTPAGTLYGQGPSGNGVLTIRGDGSGATIQLPMHRGMQALDVQRMVMYGRLLIATLPEPRNNDLLRWYDAQIKTYARKPYIARSRTARATPFESTIEWQPHHGKLIVKIEETTT